MRAVEKQKQFPDGLRLVFALLAVVMLISRSPWSQNDLLQSAIGYVGPLMWMLMAISGNKPGKARTAALVVGLAYIALIVFDIFGLGGVAA